MIDKPVILSIAGLDPSGGAGIVADVKTIAALGCFPATVITSITFQNTTGVYGAAHQTPGVLRAQIEPVINDLKVVAVKTGMLPTAEIIAEVASLVSEMQLPAPVVDPVMRATSGDSLIEASALDTLRDKLFPLARVVTPNIPEAERLVGFSIEGLDDMKRAAETIKDFGVKAVLIKGGHMPLPTSATNSQASDAVDVLVDESGEFAEFRSLFFDVGNVHGSGCTLSAAIASYLGRGFDLAAAIDQAKRYVTERIRLAQRLGHGARPL
jgi:hydroxymethylpyrimidine/phosphomethylpyrimidine kinase